MPSNSVKGETPLVLGDGRAFTLVLDMEAMLSVEEVTGKPLPQVMKMVGEGFMSATAAIAHAAFARHHPDVTRADVLAMMQSDSDALTDALGKAADTAFPKAKADVGNGRPKPSKSSPRGKTSGRSGAKRG